MLFTSGYKNNKLKVYFLASFEKGVPFQRLDQMEYFGAHTHTHTSWGSPLNENASPTCKQIDYSGS